MIKKERSHASTITHENGSHGESASMLDERSDVELPFSLPNDIGRMQRTLEQSHQDPACASFKMKRWSLNMNMKMITSQTNMHKAAHDQM